MYLYSSSNNTINNNIANNNNICGIFLKNSVYNIITNNVTENNGSEIHFGIGIYLYSSSDYNIVANNIANNNYYGISLWESSNNTIINNVVNNNRREGISLKTFSNHNTLLRNTVSSNTYGIYLIHGSSFNKISSNKISSNSEAGVAISNYNPWEVRWWGKILNNTIEFNEILNNKIGIFSQESSSTINRNVVCGNTDQDFYSNSWSLSSGDNNVCDKPDGWNDTGTTTGCKYSCSAMPIQKWSFDTDFQYNLDDDYGTVEGTGHSVGEVTLFAETLFVEGEVTIDGPLPTATPTIYLIATDGLKRESTSSEISFELISYSQIATSTFLFSATIQNPILPINNGHYELYLEIGGKLFFINTNSKINKNYLPLIILQNQLPIPIIEFSPKNPVKGVKVKFDASSSTDPDGEIINFEWQIGTTTFIGTTTEFTFNENGEYQITLIATDNDGATSSTLTTIKVEPFSFAIITDLHIGRHYQEEYEGQDYYLTERLKKVVKWINDNKDSVKCGENATCSIKFLAVLGDITENTPLVGFCKTKEILDQLQIPYVPVFGNHDVGTDKEYEQCSKWKGQDYFDQVFWSKNSIPCQNASSTKNFELLLNELNFQRDETNKDYKNFSFSFGGINFIGLDFVSREPFMKFGKGVGADAVLNEINKGWLKKKLGEFKGEPVVLLAHHPIIKDFINAFSKEEISEIESFLKESSAIFDFGGHIHSFEEFHGRVKWIENANIKYDPVASTNVLTTEALMVGSNGRGIEQIKEGEKIINGVADGKKGIVRIVKVFEKENIDPYNWEITETRDEFLAFNPSIGFGFSRQMTACVGCAIEEIPCVELKADAFCDRTKKPFIPIWSFDDGSSTTTESLTKCDFTLGTHTITLTLKDPNSDFSENISKRIEINENIIAKTINRTIDQIQKGIEFISEKAKQSFDKIRQIGKDTVYILKHSEPTLIGTITIDFDKASKDIEFSNLVADTDPTHSKTILYLPEWPSEVESLKILFIPKK
jgi:parallel beta-helix repeat protein